MPIKYLDVFYLTGQVDAQNVEFRLYRAYRFDSPFPLSVRVRRIVLEHDKLIQVVARLLSHPVWARVNEFRNVDGDGLANFSFWMIEEKNEPIVITARSETAPTIGSQP